MISKESPARNKLDSDCIFALVPRRSLARSLACAPSSALLALPFATFLNIAFSIRLRCRLRAVESNFFFFFFFFFFATSIFLRFFAIFVFLSIQLHPLLCIFIFALGVNLSNRKIHVEGITSFDRTYVATTKINPLRQLSTGQSSNAFWAKIKKSIFPKLLYFM